MSAHVDIWLNHEQPGTTFTLMCGRFRAVLGLGDNCVHRLIRLLAYLWALPYTLFGIACGLLLFGRFKVVDGVCEIHSPVIAGVLKRLPVPASAITLGHIVLARDHKMLGLTRAHERVHVRQYERWGIMFVPAYLLASAVLYLQGKDGYRDNPFEKEAYAIDAEAGATDAEACATDAEACATDAEACAIDDTDS